MQSYSYLLLLFLTNSLCFSSNLSLISIRDRDSISENFYRLSEQGDLFAAKKFIDNEIKNNSEENDKLTLGILYNLKGEFAININNQDDALKSFLIAENYFRDTNDNLNLAHTLKNIGNYHFLNKEFYIAIKNFNQASIYYTKSNHREFLSDIIIKKIETYLALKKYKRVQQILNKREEFILDTASNKTISEFYYLSALLNYELNKVDKAIENSLESKALSSNNKNKKVYINNLKLLSELHKAKLNFRLSNQYAEERQNLLDSIYLLGYDVNEKIISAKAIKDYNEAINNDLLSKQKKLQKGNPLGENTSIVFVFLLSILLIFITFLIYINQQRKKHNATLENKNLELILANKKAKEAIKTRDNFLSTVTHELRTPLYAVIGITDILLDNDPNKNQIKHLKSLKHSGDHLLSYINKILQLNKLKSSNVQMDNTNFNLKKVIENIVNTLEVSSNKNNNTIDIIYESNLPHNFFGDKTKISQIILNLIANSLKFTNNGKIDIKIYNIKKTKSHHKIGIKVSDNGIGISDDKQNEVFESFKQANTKYNETGTGLGLPIVKSLVKLLKGEISLKSKLDNGTIVTIEIPLKNSKFESKIQDPFNIELTKNQLDQIKVLVVDDNKINQTITTKILESINLKSDAVSDGRLAIESILNQDYDLILMDINMPLMNGFEATERIRTFNSKITIIALTAISNDDDDENSFKDKGFDGFISKPFRKEDFKSIIYSKIKTITERKNFQQIQL